MALSSDSVGDVVVFPEVGVLEVLHAVVESVARVERAAPGNGVYALVDPVGDHHLAARRERGGKEPLAPVAVETEGVAYVTDVCHAVIVAVVYQAA